MKNLYIFLIMISILGPALFAQSESDFDSTEVVEFTRHFPDSLQQPLYESLADAVGNWQSLAAPLSSLPDSMKMDAIWLINTMDHLDHLLMDSLTFKEHVLMSYEIRDIAKYPIPDSLFRPYILAYRIDAEPITPWRGKLFDYFWPLVEEAQSPREIAKIINLWVADSISKGEHNIFGGIQAPDMTLSRRKGTNREIALFTTAALKALGIPSRSVIMRAQGQRPGGKRWVEFLDSGEWIPLYYNNPEKLADKAFIEEDFPQNATNIVARSAFQYNNITEDYTDIGYIRAEFFIDDIPAPEFSDFSLQVVNFGALTPLDFLDTKSDSNGICMISVGDGQYYITAGTRDTKGNPSIQLLPVEVMADETTFVKIDVTPPVITDMAEFEDGKWGDVQLPRKNGKLRTVPFKDDKPTILYIYNHNGEPSIRMLEILEDNKERLKEDAVLFAISVDDIPNSGNLKASFAMMYDIKCSLYDALGYDSCQNLKDELPMVLFFPENSESRFEILSKGYDLNFMTKIDARLKK
ncbi:MAG: transglutaminase-like domain-containing protein [Candidatus Zixiibacteriota bacterium]